jgi:hypothetical protein
VTRPALSDLASGFCEAWVVDPVALKSRSRRQPLASLRQMFMLYAIDAGRSQSDVARFLGLHSSTVNVVVNGNHATS